MPFYKVNAGFRIDDITCARIRSEGIVTATFHEPVYVSRTFGTEKDTTFLIECENKAVAIAWKAALIADTGSIELYEPPPPTGGEDPPDPTLDVWARTGIWTKSIGNATTTISSLPSAPKGIIVWGSGLADAELGTFSDNGGVVFGYSNGTDNRDLAYVAQHDQSTSNANRSISKTAFHLLDPTGTDSTHYTESCTISFDTDSFDMDWDDTTIATIGHYFVFGGDDISDVVIEDYEVGTTSSGVVDYTIPGVSQKFDFGLMLYPFTSGGLPWPTAITGAEGGLSSISAHAHYVYDSWTTSIRNQDDVDPSSTSALQKKTYLLSGMSEDSSNEEQYCKFAEWTDDGFSLEWLNAPTSDDFIFSGMFVKGGWWDCGHFYQPVGVDSFRTLLWSKYHVIQGMMGFSVNKIDTTALEAGVDNAHMSIGAADNEDNQNCLVYSGSSMSSPTQEKTLSVNDKFMKYLGG